MAGQFPSNSWLWMIGKRDNSRCDICTSHLPATVGHIQCDCTALSDARTKAHNMIWDKAWSTLLKQAQKHGWQGHKETPLHKTGWAVDAYMGRLQPDGILYKEVDGDNSIWILDLTRCRGYDTKAFEDAAERKTLKYHELAQHLRDVCHSQVQIFPLPVGHAGNISECHWDSLAEALTFTSAERGKLYKDVTIAAIEAFSFMVTMWREARKNCQTTNPAVGGGSRSNIGVDCVHKT